MKKYGTLLKWSLTVGAIWIICFLYRDKIPVIYQQIKRTPVGLLVAAFLLALWYFICEGKIIGLIASLHRPGFSTGKGILAAFYCEFYRLLTFGSLTGAAEIYYLHTQGIPAGKGCGMCLSQYVIQKITISVLGVLGGLTLFFSHTGILQSYFWQILLGIALSFLIAGALLWFGLSKELLARVFYFLEKRISKHPKLNMRLQQLRKQACLMQEEIHHLKSLDKRKLLFLFLLNVLKLLGWYLIPSVLLFPGPLPSAFLTCMALAALAYVLAGIIPSPGGLGSLEFVFILLFGKLVSAEKAVSLVILYRLLTSVLPFFIGAAVVAFCQKSGDSITDFVSQT